MKKSIILIVLLFTGAVYAADVTYSINAKRDNQLTKQAARAGLTREQFARNTLLERLDANRHNKAMSYTYGNLSTICTLPDANCDD